jgi:hypothetical protein
MMTKALVGSERLLYDDANGPGREPNACGARELPCCCVGHAALEIVAAWASWRI